jgi:hypothetical protein
MLMGVGKVRICEIVQFWLVKLLDDMHYEDHG